MDTRTIERLTDLIVALDKAGVEELVPNGDSLRFRPQSAVTPDLAALLKRHKAELLEALQPTTGPDRLNRPPMAHRAEPTVTAADAGDDPVRWEDCIERPEPCPDCGGLLCWWNLLGDRRCMNCTPPTAAIRALEQVARIRRRLGISALDREKVLANLRRLTGKHS